jgi:hypothetical protein
MVTSFIGVYRHCQQYVRYSVEHGDQFYWCLTTKLVTIFYVIPDTWLKVALNTNKTGYHVIRYTWHIVESVVKQQKNWPTSSPASPLQYGGQFYWCLTPLSTMWQVKSITWWPVLLVLNATFNNVSYIFYVIPDTLLKVALNTNKTDHHLLRYN